MDIKEWCKIYLEHKDVHKKQILGFKDTDVGFNIIEKTNTTKKVLITLELNQTTLTQKYNILCTKNTKQNVEFLANNWKEFLNKDLLCIFVNIKQNKFWLIKPDLHNKITPPESLKKGLLAMHKGA